MGNTYSFIIKLITYRKCINQININISVTIKSYILGFSIPEYKSGFSLNIK